MPDTTAIPDGFTPDQLRKEAERRDLLARAKRNAERRAARNEIADRLLAIDGTLVREAGATGALTAALTLLAREDQADEETEPTNGEVNLAGPMGWWEKARVSHVQVHPLLDDLARGRRKPVWNNIGLVSPGG